MVERAGTRRAGGALHDAENGLRQLGYGGPVPRVLHHGKPGPEIVGMVAEMGCDAVVMATHGRTGLR
ncbi:MAG: universal stress protein, partial [Vicinamibacterales bacterium]